MSNGFLILIILVINDSVRHCQEESQDVLQGFTSTIKVRVRGKVQHCSSLYIVSMEECGIAQQVQFRLRKKFLAL